MSAAILSLLGLLVAVYLYLYKLGKIGSLVCGTGGCETVQLSNWSRFMGIDVALIGVLGYAALLALALVALQPALLERRWPTTVLVCASGAGVLFSLYLTYLELYVIHAICRWCVGSALIVTALLVVALLDARRLSAPAAR